MNVVPANIEKIARGATALLLCGCSRAPTNATPGDAVVVIDAASGDTQPATEADVRPATDWVVPTAAPKECRVRVSASPGVDPGPLNWRACTGIKNCSQSVTDWTDGGGSTLAVRLYEPVKLVSGKPLLSYTRRLTRKGSSELDGYVDIVEELGGSPMFAMRQLRTDDTWCGAWTSAGDWGVVSWLSLSGAKGIFVGALPKEQAASAMRFAFITNEQLMVLPPEGGPQFASVGPTHYFLETVSPSSTAIIDPTAPAARPRPAPLPAAVGPRSYNDGALAYSADSGGWGYLTAAGEFTRWHTVAGRETTALSIDRSTGAIVWVDSVNSNTGFSEPTLYTSPAAKRAADVIPSKVAVLRDELDGGSAGMVANSGLALAIASRTVAVVVDLKTGSQTEIAAPSDVAWVLPLWIGAGEAWILGGKSGIPNPQLATNTIVRIRL